MTKMRMPTDGETTGTDLDLDRPGHPGDGDSVVLLPCGVRLVGARTYEVDTSVCQTHGPVRPVERERPRALFPVPTGAAGVEARPLSDREREVLSLLVGGASDKEVAGALGLSRSTVESHVGNLYQKTGAANRVQLGVLAIERGLIWSSYAIDQALA